MTDSEPHQDLHEALGRTIRARRAECDMTLRELGRLTAISYSYLAEIERGTSGKQVSTDKLVKIAEALGISPSELLGRGEQLRDSLALRATDPGSRSPSSWRSRSQSRSPDPSADLDAAFDARAADDASPASCNESPPQSDFPDVRERSDEREADELRWRIAALIEGAAIEDLRVLASLADDLRRRALELQQRARQERRRS